MRLYVKLQQMGEDQFFLQQVYCKYTADVPHECLYVDLLNNVFNEKFSFSFHQLLHLLFSRFTVPTTRFPVNPRCIPAAATRVRLAVLFTTAPRPAAPSVFVTRRRIK